MHNRTSTRPHPPALAVPESPPLDVGCEVNPDCPVHKACFNRVCRDPCVVNDPCGLNAFCRVEAHQAVCRCPEGYLGNPRVECKLREYSFQDRRLQGRPNRLFPRFC